MEFWRPTHYGKQDAATLLFFLLDKIGDARENRRVNGLVLWSEGDLALGCLRRLERKSATATTFCFWNAPALTSAHRRLQTRWRIVSRRRDRLKTTTSHHTEKQSPYVPDPEEIQV